MNEELILNMLKNIDNNISDLKTHGDDLKTGFEELKNGSIKYHTIVDGLTKEITTRHHQEKELNNKLEKIIKNGYKIEIVEKRVDRLANVAKHGFIMGVGVTFIMGTIAFLAKTSNFLSRVIN